jgi:hypothetical protein
MGLGDPLRADCHRGSKVLCVTSSDEADIEESSWSRKTMEDSAGCAARATKPFLRVSKTPCLSFTLASEGSPVMQTESSFEPTDEKKMGGRDPCSNKSQMGN